MLRWTVTWVEETETEVEVAVKIKTETAWRKHR